jgi:hypothetical protein
MIKTQKDIENDLTQAFAALQRKVTGATLGQVIRAIFIAVSGVFAEAWNDLNALRRQRFWMTSQGSDLDYLGQEEGLQRYGSTFASTIIVVQGQVATGASTATGNGFLTDANQNFVVNNFTNGTWILLDSLGNKYPIIGNTTTTISVDGTPASGIYYILPVLPAGTTVQSSATGAAYTTQTDVIVGLQNPNLLGQSQSISLGDRTVVIAQAAGSAAAAQANTITILSPAINGIVSITNPVATQPVAGLDGETDSQFLARRQSINNLLDITTLAFYEALAQYVDSDVLRCIAQKDPTTGGVILTLVSRSGAFLTDTELANIATLVYNQSRAFDTVTCVNMVLTDISVSISSVMQPGTVLANTYVETADTLADLMDYSAWDPSNTLDADAVLVALKNISDYQDIDLTTFTLTATKGGNPAGSETISFNNSLPRLARLRIINSVTNETLDYVLQQEALNII